MRRTRVGRFSCERWPLRIVLSFVGIGMALPVSIASVLVLQAITPPAWAQAAPLTLNLPTRRGEDYGRLVRRAEDAARRAAQQIFSNNPTNEIALTVVGENQNLAAPLLTMQVTRSDWLRSPNPRQWSTYYPTAEGLLQLQPSATGSPAIAPLSSPTPTVNESADTTTVRESSETAPSSNAAGTSVPSEESPNSTPPEINIPAAPAGQLGLPRSILGE